MTWIRIDTDFPRNPVIGQLAERLRLKPNDALAPPGHGWPSPAREPPTPALAVPGLRDAEHRDPGRRRRDHAWVAEHPEGVPDPLYGAVIWKVEDDHLVARDHNGHVRSMVDAPLVPFWSRLLNGQPRKAP